MKIRRVTAHAFGPLRDTTLVLSDGLTVIYGPNEAAKSTWHAAIYAAVCGLRRGPGMTTRERQFAERHRPWGSNGEWLVSAELRLADGRRVEMRQDLAQRAASHAKDLDLGRDLSGEIIRDGAPDAAVWLGLDRQSFAATAFVAQARMLDVLAQPDGLQELLQRAAATARQEATAAAALARIDEFRKEHVGTENAPTRPLRRAMTAVTAARADLDRARAEFAAYQRRQQEVERLRQAEATALRELHRYEAAALHARAATILARAEEARRLEERLASMSGRAAGRTDAAVNTEVSDDELWELARSLEPEENAGPDGSDAGGDHAVQAAAAALSAARRAKRRAGWLVAVAALVAVAGGAAQIVGAPAALAAGAYAAAAVLAGAGLVLLSRSGVADAQRELAAAKGAHAARQQAQRLVGERRRAAIDRCVRLGLPADPAVLRDLVRQRAAAAAERSAEHQRARDRLAHLLDGSTVVDLLEEAKAIRERAENLGFAADESPEVGAPDEERLAELREAARAATEQAAAATGALETVRQSLQDLPAAEERLAAADGELARLRRLDETLRRTALFLAKAQERVHRDIAPVLAESVRQRLPAVTAGRYQDVIVNPADLRVQVCGPDRQWRRAELLSHGTAEQVYLLLRIALAEHLTKPGELCPLILDDVVVHADDERAAQLLALVRTAAEERQIVLFTHQTRVRDWARAELHPPAHSLIELDPVPA